MMDLEFRRFKIDDVSEDGRTIIGHAAVFGNRDSYGDVIEPGAFAKTIAERKDRVKVFYNHTYPIGKPVEMAEDDNGLYTVSRLSSTPRANEILELIRDGVIDEMSIAFETLKYDNDPDKGRRLRELRLYEYGPVDFAANDQALITGVKSLAQRLEQGQNGSFPLQEIKNAIDQLETAIKRAQPSNDTAPKPSLVDTSVMQYKNDWIDAFAQSARTIHRRINHE